MPTVNQSGHIAYVNTKAFEVAGVTNKTPNPPGGGIYVKDAEGNLTGKLIEAMRNTTKKLAMKGITTSAEITVGANLGLDNELGLYQYLMANGGLPVRVRAYLYGSAIPKGFNTIKPNQGDERLRFVGVKFLADGSTQGLTAALNEPYIYPTGTKNKGSLNYQTETLLNDMRPYFDQGWQISIHANGDRVIDQALENYNTLLAGVANPKTGCGSRIYNRARSLLGRAVSQSNRWARSCEPNRCIGFYEKRGYSLCVFAKLEL